MALPLAAPVVLGGKLFFTTYLPEASSGACEAQEGGGRLYAVDVLSGKAVINFDGTMVLCCADYPREVVIGNVADESICDLWNGKKMQGIRAALSGAKGKPPGMCQRCLIAE